MENKDNDDKYEDDARVENEDEYIKTMEELKTFSVYYSNISFK